MNINDISKLVEQECEARIARFKNFSRQLPYKVIKVENKKGVMVIGDFEVNDRGYVIFNNKSWRTNGDKKTFVMLSNGTLTMRYAKGNVTDNFLKELELFCDVVGVDLDYWQSWKSVIHIKYVEN